MRKLFYNGTILTMDQDKPQAAAVAVEGDRIAEVYEEVPADWNEERIDLCGRSFARIYRRAFSFCGMCQWAVPM